MIYCLDTNICIYAVKNLYSPLRERMELLPPELLAIPAMVKAELLYGAERSSRPESSRLGMERFIGPLAVLPFDDEATLHYARIRNDLERIGKPIGTEGMIIAATALSRGAVLVTNNVREFSRVSALVVEDWTKS